MIGKLSDHPQKSAPRDAVDGSERCADDPRAMDFASLIAAFQAETAAHFAGRVGAEQFALELFRRAVLDGNQDAWRAIYEAYRPLITGWITHHPSFLRCGEDSGFLVNRAFERFWLALRPHRLADFPGLRALLKYLKLCAHCVVIDTARSYRQADHQPLDTVELAGEGPLSMAQAEGLAGAEQVWRTVAGIVRDPVQERLAWDTLVVGLAPREVLAADPGRWHSVREVYDARALLLRRLRASPELTRLRGDPSRAA